MQCHNSDKNNMNTRTLVDFKTQELLAMGESLNTLYQS
jgi:hypothetical protein